MSQTQDEKSRAEQLYQMSVGLRAAGYRNDEGTQVRPSELDGGALCWDEQAEKYWSIFGMPIDSDPVQHDIEEMATVTNMNFRTLGSTKLAQAYDLPGMSDQLGCSGPVYEGE